MDTRSKRTAVIAATALLAIAVAACGGTNAKADPESDARRLPEQITVGLALPNLENDFFAELRRGAEAEADAHGATLVVTDAKGSADTQAQQLRQLAEQEATAVVLTPVDSSAAADAVRALRDRHVPVVAADRKVEGAKTDSTVASDHTQGGWKAAATLAELLDGKGKIVHLRGPRGTSVSEERGQGFTAGLEEHPGLDVVDRARAGFDREAGRKAMAQLLAKHPDLTGVFAENDEMALGAIDALGQRAGTSVQVVGFDGTPKALRAMDEGKLAATIAQDPADLGKLAVRNALRVAAGQQVEPDIQVPVRVVTGRS